MRSDCSRNHWSSNTTSPLFFKGSKVIRRPTPSWGSYCTACVRTELLMAVNRTPSTMTSALVDVGTSPTLDPVSPASSAG